MPSGSDLLRMLAGVLYTRAISGFEPLDDGSETAQGTKKATRKGAPSFR
jgi:hypothetical protein